jgi:iron complex transport system ATP-binding protein
VSEANAPAVRLAGVTVRFGSRNALQGVDLSIRPGEFVALAGPNGSGKTTLLRALLGLVEPVEGGVELFGAPVQGLSIRDRARRIAWVPQEEGTRDAVPVLEYVLYGRYAHLGFLEGESGEDRRRAARLLEEVGLADRAGDSILSLSGGERQRATLARALAQDAPLLLLDEPTTHLDIGHQLDLLERVRRLSRERGVTVLAALHDLNLAARYADRVVVLSRGRRYADGPPATVLSEDLLVRVWGVVADLRRDPRSGAPYLVPHRVVAAAAPGAEAGFGPVHVVGGGGAATPYLRTLADEGYLLTAGALHLLDTDCETAESLGVPAAVEVPFAPLSAEVRDRHRALLARARAIVVAPFAVGPSNLANLEDLLPFAGKAPMLLVGPPPGTAWDFAGGAGVAAREQLLARGAREVRAIEELRRELKAIALARAEPTPA